MFNLYLQTLGVGPLDTREKLTARNDSRRNVPLEVGVSKVSWEKPGHAMVHRFPGHKRLVGWVGFL